MKRTAKKAGEGTDISKDYEYTDCKQVERYAKRLSRLCYTLCVMSSVYFSTPFTTWPLTVIR